MVNSSGVKFLSSKRKDRSDEDRLGRRDWLFALDDVELPSPYARVRSHFKVFPQRRGSGDGLLGFEDNLAGDSWLYWTRCDRVVAVRNPNVRTRTGGQV